MSVSLGTIIGEAKKYIENEVAPVVASGVASLIKFFQLVGVDPQGASAHFISAFATIAALGLVFVVFRRSLIAIDALLQRFGEFGSWIIDVVVGIKDFATQELSAVLKKILIAAFKLDTYKAISLWLCMLDKEVAASLSNSFKDGPVHVKYQKNLGYSVVAISLWSTLAFAYAIYVAASGFDKKPDYLGVVMLFGSIIYGVLIFTLDRSIIAPFTPLDSARAPVSLRSVGFRAWLLDFIDINFGAIFRVFLRLIVAYFIAQFTAIPLTVFILHGGIVDAIKKEGDLSRDKVESEIIKVETAFREAGKNVRTSPPCIAATNALKDLTDQINLTASSGCPPGWTSCPGPRTKELQATKPKYEQDKVTACAVSSSEIKAYDENIARLNKQKDDIKDNVNPDILMGAKYLSSIDKNDNSIYKPVRSTFMLLFAIELIPVFAKIVCDAKINRRRRQFDNLKDDYSSLVERRSPYLAASREKVM